MPRQKNNSGVDHREQGAQFSALMETTTEAVVVTDLQGCIRQANTVAAATFGREELELVGMDGLELVAPEARDDARERLRLAAQGTLPANEQHTLLRKDGSRFEGIVNAAMVTDPDGGPLGLVVVFRDISKRQEAEQHVAQYQVLLRRLASDLVLAEERERRRIASELHERVGQNLALCRLRMSAMLESPPGEEAAGPLHEIADLLDFIIQDVRTLTVELSPPVLYELSFLDAVSWLGDRARERSGLAVEVVDDGQPKPLSEDVGVFLFKAIQELLVNVTKHADASSAKVSLARAADIIQVAVEDDGAGFDVQEQDSRLQASAGFGLFSIRERLNPLGGSIDVVSSPGRGTRVTLTAPLDVREVRT